MTPRPPTPWVELKTLRELDGHTLQSLADAIGTSRGYLHDLETGRRQATPRVTKVLARALKVPVSVLKKDPEAAA